jgi:hypothetical protein
MTNSWIGLRKPGLLATVAPLSMLLGALSLPLNSLTVPHWLTG